MKVLEDVGEECHVTSVTGATFGSDTPAFCTIVIDVYTRAFHFAPNSTFSRFSGANPMPLDVNNRIMSFFSHKTAVLVCTQENVVHPNMKAGLKILFLVSPTFQNFVSCAQTPPKKRFCGRKMALFCYSHPMAWD